MTALAPSRRRLAQDCRAAAAVEFAFAGPIVIMLMFGVLQIGMAMHSYNAIRSVAAETARYTVVQYQQGLTPNTSAIEAQARAIATGGAYLLKADGLTVQVANAAEQRVKGAQEMLLTVSYTIPAIMPFADWSAISIDHSRPIFVIS